MTVRVTTDTLPGAESRLDARARQSLGVSADAIYRLTARVLRERGAAGTLVDAGCGTGNLWRTVSSLFSRCVAVDAVRYDGFDDDERIAFQAADLDREPLPVSHGSADVAAAVEVIEHLENPRAFVRELVRVVRPGGLVVITTPNQLSLLSLLTLIAKQRFSAFQDASYPAHRTALLEIDLRRIAAECGLCDVEIRYTCRGRVPLTGAHYPAVLSTRFPRALSDNVLMVGRRG
jgi:2-polyprenyl-3-methyl-5-hydroxy-6-metoxy-1,4-benzoquinol methylase